MSTLAELVTKYAEVKELRAKLDQASKELKQGPEADLQAQILQLLTVQGMKSANVDGLGRVVSRETTHFEIKDIDKLSYFMLQQMVAAAQAGRPVSDGLLLQLRVHEGNLDHLLEQYPDADEAFLMQLGVKRATKTTLSFTRS